MQFVFHGVAPAAAFVDDERLAQFVPPEARHTGFVGTDAIKRNGGGLPFSAKA
jgi:hypothetical protein